MRTLPEQAVGRLKALNSTVRFVTQVRERRDEDGRAVIDPATGKPFTDQTLVAELYNNADNRQWCRAEGADEASALEAVLAKADTVDRPATTAKALEADRDRLAEENARLQAELERLRNTDSIRARPTGSQRKRDGGETEPAESKYATNKTEAKAASV